MRLIGTLDEEQLAQRFQGYLYSQGIESQVDANEGGGWEVWVLDDDQVEPAQSFLETYQLNPDATEYVQGSRKGQGQRQQDEKARTGRRYRTVDSRQVFANTPMGMGIVTLVLIAISVVVALITRLGDVKGITLLLQISAGVFQNVETGQIVLLHEVRQGQVWRLITPIFLHFSILHILFNMFWLRSLGSVIEYKRGSIQFLVLVFVLALLSNLTQYLIVGPYFGGMSGVVYGLLGYLWVQGKMNPRAGLDLHPQTATIMLIYLVICFTGVMEHVANAAHLGGLVVGLGYGAVGAFWQKHSR